MYKQWVIPPDANAAFVTGMEDVLEVYQRPHDPTSGQCLDRRISDKPSLIEEVAAWQASRSKRHVTTDWRFTTADARVKLKRLLRLTEAIGVPIWKFAAPGSAAFRTSRSIRTLAKHPFLVWFMVLKSAPERINGVADFGTTTPGSR